MAVQLSNWACPGTDEASASPPACLARGHCSASEGEGLLGRRSRLIGARARFVHGILPEGGLAAKEPVSRTSSATALRDFEKRDGTLGHPGHKLLAQRGLRHICFAKRTYFGTLGGTVGLHVRSGHRRVLGSPSSRRSRDSRKGSGRRSGKAGGFRAYVKSCSSWSR